MKLHQEEQLQGQARWGSEQPDRFEDVPAYGRGVELDGLWRSLWTQTILWFHVHANLK